MSYTSPAPPIHDHSFQVHFDEINQVPYTMVANSSIPREQAYRSKSLDDKRKRIYTRCAGSSVFLYNARNKPRRDITN